MMRPGNPTTAGALDAAYGVAVPVCGEAAAGLASDVHMHGGHPIEAASGAVASPLASPHSPAKPAAASDCAAGRYCDSQGAVICPPLGQRLSVELGGRRLKG